MTTYKPFQDSSQTPGTVQNDGTAYIFGLNFTPSSNCTLEAVWWYVGSSPHAQSTNLSADEQICACTVNGKYSFALIAGSVTSAGTYSAGWNRIAFGTPIPLTAGVEYSVQKGISGLDGTWNYTAVPNFFNGPSSGAGGNGLTDGPVLVYADGVNGSTNLEPFAAGQQSFLVGGANVSPPAVGTSFPNNTFGSTWYGMDIEVSTSGGGTAHTATVSSTVTPTVTVGRSQGHKRSMLKSVTPTFTINRTRGHNRSVSLTVTPARTVAKSAGHKRTVSLTVSNTRTVNGSNGGAVHTKSVSLTVTPTFTVSRQRGRVRTVSLTVTPTRTVNRVHGHNRSAALTVTPTSTIARVAHHLRTVLRSVLPSVSIGFSHGIVASPLDETKLSGTISDARGFTGTIANAVNFEGSIS